MNDLQPGDKAPDFKTATDKHGTISLSDYKGRKLVLYFYPKDDTPGCTKQACGFNENLEAFQNLNVDVIGVSKDPVQKHQKFREKYDLEFPLIADEETILCQKYGVWKEKNMYGKKLMGIERTTFLIEEQGRIEKIWRKVKVKDHIEEVLDAARDRAS